MKLLGIESSCDETAAAIIEALEHKGIETLSFNVLSNVVASQVKIHARTGGVVPEIAARHHVEAIIPVIDEAFKIAKIKPESIDAIAVTVGPGLITSLRVGVDTARILSRVWQKPLVAVNHLEGHIYANWLPPIDKIPVPSEVEGQNPKSKIQNIEFPILCLIVSGGHTELVLMRDHLDYKIIGQTLDDAAGEAFDKVAKILDLGYPGGPVVSRMAGSGNPEAIKFPRPMLDKNNFDFSFAGLKTSVLYYVRQNTEPEIQKTDICASFEQAVVDVLVAKTIRAAERFKVKTMMLGGGVAANRRLREELGQSIKQNLPPTFYNLPPLEYTGDNAAMIAAVGAYRAAKKDFINWKKIDVDPNLSL